MEKLNDLEENERKDAESIRKDSESLKVEGEEDADSGGCKLPLLVPRIKKLFWWL